MGRVVSGFLEGSGEVKWWVVVWRGGEAGDGEEVVGGGGRRRKEVCVCVEERGGWEMGTRE